MDDSFIDLRLNQRASQSEDSFWPSFTDIMTVIVMIFLLAMVILLLRNMELLSELRATIAAEQQAIELARTTGAENETLEDRLIAREHELSMLRMQLLRMEEESEQQEAAIASQRNQLNDLSKERDTLATRVSRILLERDDLKMQTDRLTDESKRLQNQLVDANRSIDSMNQEISRLELSQESTLKDLDSLRSAYTQQEQALQSALADNQQTDRTLADLQSEYQSLKIKYDKLLRPARSAKGKTVVEVRYRKVKGVFRIDYKGPGSNDFKSISRKGIDNYLSRLKKEQPNGLYIKVILPKNSGLSYSEAWSFTNHLHRSYDYYYQEEGQQERIIAD